MSHNEFIDWYFANVVSDLKHDLNDKRKAVIHDENGHEIDKIPFDMLGPTFLDKCYKYRNKQFSISYK